MRLRPMLFLLLTGLAFLVLCCDQDLTSSKDQPLVDYVVAVTDSATRQPLDSVTIRVKTISGDTVSMITNPSDGRAEFPSVASKSTQLVLSRPGYRTIDTVDTVNALPDTVFHRATVKVLNIKLPRLGGSVLNRPQFNLFLRDAALNPLTKGRATYIDSTGFNRTVSDGDSDGVIGLSGLKIGKNQIRVESSGFLGHWFEVEITQQSDSSLTIPNTTVTLLPLSDEITGAVYVKTSTGSKPLMNARVVFHLTDSSAYPDSFSTLTLSKLGSEGKFTLSNVPALDGEMRYYKDNAAQEPTLTKPIRKEEVLQDGPLALVTLTLNADSSGLPLLVSGPKSTLNLSDSVNAADTLQFKFNQAVDAVDDITINLINTSAVWIKTSWSSDKTLLKIWPHDGTWEAGKKYEFSLTMRDVQGNYFSVPGDTVNTINGVFSVRTGLTLDSNLAFPKNFVFSSFNSGALGQYSDLDSNTSPKADSSSQYARLKWTWSSTTGRHVDSLVLYYKDGGVTATNWQLWGAAPMIDDSLTLNFSDHYATMRDKNHNPDFPLRSGGKIFFMAVPKTRTQSFDDSAATLASVEQGMGPTVYWSYTAHDSMKTLSRETDSLKVTFLADPSDPSSEVDWGSSPPMPKLLFNGADSSGNLQWRWLANHKEGYVIYTLPDLVPAPPKIQVDLNGVIFNAKPIWQRNRNNPFILRAQ